MTSVAGLSLREPILPLKQSFNPKDLCTTKVEWEWTTGMGDNTWNKTAKIYLPICDNPSNKELFLYVIDQFIDSAAESRLHLMTGPS
jgi:hypothetical protein